MRKKCLCPLFFESEADWPLVLSTLIEILNDSLYIVAIVGRFSNESLQWKEVPCFEMVIWFNFHSSAQKCEAGMPKYCVDLSRGQICTGWLWGKQPQIAARTLPGSRELILKIVSVAPGLNYRNE